VVHQLMPHLKQASALLPLPARGASRGMSHSHVVATNMSMNAQSPAHHSASQQADDMNNIGRDVDMDIDTAPLRFPGPVSQGRPVASAAMVTPTDPTPANKNVQRKTS